MTIINPKSISGITSITTASGADNLLTVHTNNTTERIRINNDGDVIVGSGITVSPDGDIFATGVTTATTFSGSGASLTNLPAANITGTLPAISGANLTNLDASDLASGTVPTARLGSGTASSSTFLRGDSTFAAVTSTTINNNADNRLITGSGTANTLEGESNLTFGSDLLNISSTTSALGLRLTNTGNEYTNIQFSAARTGADSALGIINAKWNNTSEVAAIYLTAGDDTTNKDDGKIKFYTSAASGSLANRMEILNDGDVKITDGDLVIGTSGHGIDFSATGQASGMTSELLQDYEEGTWTPVIQGTGANNGKSYSQQLGKYTLIGNICHAEFSIAWTSYNSNDSGEAIVNGLPYTIDSNIGTGAAIGALVGNNLNFVNGTFVTAAYEAANGQNYMYILVTYDAAGWSNPPASSFWQNTGNIRGAVTYRIN